MNSSTINSQMDPNTFDGFSFSEIYPGGRASGVVEIDASAQEVRFSPKLDQNQPPLQILHIPFHELTLELGGSNRKLLFFKSSNPDFQGVFYTRNLKALKSGGWSSDFSLHQTAQKLASSNRAQTWILWIGMILLLGIIPLLFQLRGPAADWVAQRIPPEMEIKLGNLIFTQFESEGKILEPGAWDEDLKAITQPLLNALESTPYDFRFYLKRDSSPNAFALPGGIIVIHTGLIEMAETPEQVAGVLAHEIGHVVQQHSLRNMVHTAGFAILVQSIFGDISGLIAVIGDRATFLMSRKFSREFETEADEFGWNLLTQANIDPRGQIQVFGILKDYQEQTLGKESSAALDHLEIINTHPATGERIRKLEEKWNNRPTGANNDFIEFDLSFSDLKHKIPE